MFSPLNSSLYSYFAAADGVSGVKAFSGRSNTAAALALLSNTSALAGGGCNCQSCQSKLHSHGHSHSSHGHSHSHSHSRNGAFSSSTYSGGAAQRLSHSVFDSLVGLPEDAIAFTTVTKNGDRIYNGNRRNFSANAERKWTRSDGKADGRGATVVTFAFDDEFNVNGISNSQAKTLLKSALQTWANYAPLDFVEVKDPGSASAVDILVQSENIDGRSGTLAYAFFPGTGDITFDNSEDWTESTFLEAAVHELGHSLGLDHEDDVDAIMNSVLARRFSDKAYLLQDDINGIRSLYGKGVGSVTSLDDRTADPISLEPVSLPNLVTNGSFEDSPLSDGTYGIYRQIKGWSLISGNGFQVDKRPDVAGEAADGSTWVELDTYGANATIGQNIDTVTGESYNLSVSFTDGGRPANTTGVDVFWDGKKLGRLSGGSKGVWKTFDYLVQGGDRSVSTLAFRAVGKSDNVGGFIDNIVVTEARQALTAPVTQALGTATADPTMHRDLLSGDAFGSESRGLVASGLHSEAAFSNVVSDGLGWV